MLTGGCALTLSPPDHRARQYSTQFDGYPTATRERLLDATVAPGDDRTAVYIALGNPHKRRVSYGRNATTGATIMLEYWDYAGYPTGRRKWQFATLNNGGFASPLGNSAYGRVSVEFADAVVRDCVYVADETVPSGSSRYMFVPSDPHQ